MALIRPRLSDHYGLAIPQPECDFVIPLLDEDLPLYVDPFLLWRSPSLQDTGLHTQLVGSFDSIIRLYGEGARERAVSLLVSLSECDEAGLGMSASRSGRRMGEGLARDLLETVVGVDKIRDRGIGHIEVIQLLVDGVGKDRISDISCSLLKSFLIDFTIEQAKKWGIPTKEVQVPEIFDPRDFTFRSEAASLPTAPGGRGVLLVPKRWLRYSPWIDYDKYYAGGFVPDGETAAGRVAVLMYNRQNYGMVESFVSQREAAAAECTNDPVFRPISVISAKRRMAGIRGLETGRDGNADRKFEDLAGSVLASVLHPYLDYAGEQERTDSGVLIRDLIFYNTRTWDFLEEVGDTYASRQLVFELKNVKALTRDHINQLNRYLTDAFGRFGVLVTRTPPSTAMMKNLIDLWSGQRRCILVLTDADLELMVTLFESGQRKPIEVLKRSYVTFTRSLPS